MPLLDADYIQIYVEQKKKKKKKKELKRYSWKNLFRLLEGRPTTPSFRNPRTTTKGEKGGNGGYQIWCAIIMPVLDFGYHGMIHPKTSTD